MLSSSSNLIILVTSDFVLAMALYLAFKLDRDIIYCFLSFQRMGEFLNIMTYPVIDFLISTQDSQSESEYASKISLSWPLSLILCPKLITRGQYLMLL